MTRPRKWEQAAVEQAFHGLTATIGRTPTVREYADHLGVSTRTAWRYMRNRPLRVKCRHCHGTGYVDARRKVACIRGEV